MGGAHRLPAAEIKRTTRFAANTLRLTFRRVSPETGSNRVKRGGSWNNNANNLRSANRNNNTPTNRNNNIGFRLVSTEQRRNAPFTDCVCVHQALSREASCTGDVRSKSKIALRLVGR